MPTPRISLPTPLSDSPADFASMQSSAASFLVTLGELVAIVENCPRDRILNVFLSVVADAPRRFEELLSIYFKEQDRERKEDYFRALRTVVANQPEIIGAVDPCMIAKDGYLRSLNVLHLPTGARQGAGLLVDFHLISQLSLRPLGDVRFLPLPAPFPKRLPVSRNGICEYPGPREDCFRATRYSETVFGRSARYSDRNPQTDRAVTHSTVLKKARDLSPEGLEAVRYEATVMEYFLMYQNYFGLESRLPFPIRGPGNRVHAWKFEGVAHLQYEADPDYFRYFEDLKSSEEIAAAAGRNVRDLMRLARFGIFHTELAPIYHSVTQQRIFLWNVGGLLPGPGDLEYWRESFAYANERYSGIADFEHCMRWQRLPATSAIVNDTESQEALGLQYHLGNILFCTFHLVALAHANLEHASQPHALDIERILRDAYQAFTGREWITLHLDVDCERVARELGIIRKGPHVGEFAGAYPLQGVIQALTAFTLRAIPEFVWARSVLRADLPEPIRQSVVVKEPTVPNRGAVSPDPFFLAIESLLVMDTVVAAGFDRSEIPALVRNMTLGDVSHPIVADNEITYGIRIPGLFTAIRRTVPKQRAREIIEKIEWRKQWELTNPQNHWIIIRNSPQTNGESLPSNQQPNTAAQVP